MAIWHPVLKFEVQQTGIIVNKSCHTLTQGVQIQKSVPKCHYYVTPNWMGTIAL